MITISVVVQHRHVHLSEKDKDELFGSVELDALCALNHRGQMVCAQTVTVKSKDGHIENIHVLGPSRKETQIELAASDAYALGLNAPVRVSGDTARSATCRLIGPEGEIEVKSGTIVPARHLHCNPKDAEKLGLSHHDVIALGLSNRDQVIDYVTVRVHPTFALEFHLTTDEAAQYWIHTGDRVIVK